jgi:hypothetical protein
VGTPPHKALQPLAVAMLVWRSSLSFSAMGFILCSAAKTAFEI